MGQIDVEANVQHSHGVVAIGQEDLNEMNCEAGRGVYQGWVRGMPSSQRIGVWSLDMLSNTFFPDARVTPSPGVPLLSVVAGVLEDRGGP